MLAPRKSKKKPVNISIMRTLFLIRQIDFIHNNVPLFYNIIRIKVSIKVSVIEGRTLYTLGNVSNIEVYLKFQFIYYNF